MASSPLSLLPMVFSQLLTQIPVIVVCIVGLVLLAGRRASAPAAVNWAIAGFGLGAALAFFIPLTYGMLTFLQVNGTMALGSHRWLYPVLGAVSALLHAGTYLLFLLAFLAFFRPAARAV